MLVCWYCHKFIISGTVLKTFNVTDPDSDGIVTISVSDPTTIDYANFTQTHGSSIHVEVLLKEKLDRDRVCSMF